MDTPEEIRPSVSKACHRCHMRKVKVLDKNSLHCDLRVPQCSACSRHNEECNIVDCVAYPHSVIASLQQKIQNLERQLEEANGASNQQEAPGAGSGAGGESRTPEQQAWADSIRNEAEEVGVLAVGGNQRRSQGQYIGSAAGSTFARIFFTMLRLTPPDRLKDASSSGQTLPERDAALPPRNVARFLFHQYIAQVHIWWPFLPLSLLRGTFQRIYKDTRGCGDFDKLLIFMVLALSSAECSDNAEYIAMTDINSPLNYFRTGLRFFTASSERARDLQSLQAIVLMTILMLKSGIPSLHGDLWHLSRYVMSAAIELGLHRHNAHWGFSPEELEVRNRTWWSIYCLERQIAVMTGRVLSVRDHAIHSPMPMDSSIDQLEPAEAAAAPLFQRHGHRVFSSMIGPRRIGGRVLESVYIARGPDHKALFTSFQQICSEVDSIRGSLERWKVDVEALEMKHSRVYYEFKVEYCLILLLLNRPSATFMIPSHQMVAVCSRAASSVVRQWSKIRCEYGVSAIGTGFRTLHSVVMVGLAALYCDWQSYMCNTSRNGTEDGPFLFTHGSDTAFCIELVDQCIHEMRDEGLSRYKLLLQAVRAKVYGPNMVHPPSAAGLGMDTSGVHVTMLNPSEGGTLDLSQPWISGQDQGLQNYVDEIIGFFNEDMNDVDDGLREWYSSIVNEVQPQGAA